MLDQTYIDELKSNENVKEAKEQLFEHAESLNIRLYKKDTLDKMIAMYNKKYEKLSNEPMPDEPSNGLTIADLIEADDTLNGNSFNDDVKPEAIAALTGQLVETPIEDVVDKIIEPIVVEVIKHIEPTVTIVEDVKPTKEFELPKNFSPTVSLMGPAPGYTNIPYWVYDFIVENENWKNNIEDFKHKQDHKMLYSLFYYIQKNGSVKIRESRNSGFHVIN